MKSAGILADCTFPIKENVTVLKVSWKTHTLFSHQGFYACPSKLTALFYICALEIQGGFKVAVQF
jgi:hypothetical protein